MKETKYLTYFGSEKVIYQDGWWMTRGDYDHIQKCKANNQEVGLDKHETTRQLTYYYL